jgi:GTP-dependent phosphoenolpyruvate carboxykinase
MSEKVQIEGKSNLVRDINSKALLNTDLRSLNEYQLKKKMMISMEQNESEINNIKERLSKIDSIESDLKDIKDLLQRIINK